MHIIAMRRPQIIVSENTEHVPVVISVMGYLTLKVCHGSLTHYRPYKVTPVVSLTGMRDPNTT